MATIRKYLEKKSAPLLKKNEFAVYPVTHISEGIELLTGITAGKADAGANYPEDTVFGRANKKLFEFAEAAKGEINAEDN